MKSGTSNNIAMLADTIVTKSTAMPKLAVVQGALSNDNLDRLRSSDASAPTRSRMLATLMVDPEMRKRIGGAWPLYLMLMLEWDGLAAGTRDEIGGRMGESGRNVGNWVGSLEQAEIVGVERHGRRMTVKLVGQHMEIAQMPDKVTEQDAKPAEPFLGERQKSILDLMDKATSMGGEAEVRIVVKAK